MIKYGVTKEKMEADIAYVEYIKVGAASMICSITLVNGFIIHGGSDCVDPNMFDEKRGKEIAYKNALSQLGSILSYTEKERWYRETKQSARDKVAEELVNLDLKRSELIAFIDKGQPYNMGNAEWDLIRKQDEAMGAYGLILQERLVMMKKRNKVVHSMSGKKRIVDNIDPNVLLEDLMQLKVDEQCTFKFMYDQNIQDFIALLKSSPQIAECFEIHLNITMQYELTFKRIK